jgi:hypothetical protein
MKIVHGEDVTLALLVKDSEGEAYDLSGTTEITARFQKTDNTILSKLKTDGDVVITSAVNGRMTVALSDSDTTLLKKGDNLGFELWIDVGSTRRIVQFLRVIDVAQKMFS